MDNDMPSRPVTRALRGLFLAGLTVLGIVSGPVSAQAEVKSVKIGVSGTSFLNLTYYYLLLPDLLGYWREEGYDVDVFPVSGSYEAVQQLAANNLDFAQIGAIAIIQSNTERGIPIRGVVTNGTLGVGIAVQKDGPIKSASDLRGQNIGIVSLSSSAVPLLNSYLNGNGLYADDVTLVATGVGASALNALESGRVQGLMYWRAALVGFENAGAKINILRDPAWAAMPDYTFATSQKTIDRDPKMVEGIARGIAKAMVFAAANPDCVRRLLWKKYPDTKPTGVDEERAVATDMALMTATLEDQRQAIALNPNGYTAATSVQAFGKYQDFLFKAGVLTREIEPVQFAMASEGLWAKVNDFDKVAIEKKASACK
ncbi:ABC transporter substrate-binding protein [Labrys sp. La1]|uniref:ABC transporter substrate-binding protein n=1 Tax=Labrys sp. La1 TaxID=3404917 RepID=UPI003EB9C4F6